jgi:3',5'-cyclic AMP phosphodiesterase CpdA
VKDCCRLIVLLIFLASCHTGGAQDEKARLRPKGPGSSFSFAVLGDNRGESDGRQYPPFIEILNAINKAAPDLVLNTGDLINGYKGDDEPLLRQQWAGYRGAVSKLNMPVFNTPGNHDIFDELSARLWKELWGPTYYSFDYGSARFISLDTETERGRIGAAQFDWLGRQLGDAGRRHVFIFFHQPLFPVDGHVGNSLDRYPLERDRLHELFVTYKGVIKGIFQGHEHLYNFEERDGVPYYITGGAGAELYVPPALGGFYHYLLVRVHKDDVSVSLRKVYAGGEPSGAITRVAPGTLLEGWENPLFWYTWNQSVNTYTTAEKFTEGRQALGVSFDLSKYEWPTLYLPLHPALDFSQVEQLMVDVYVPRGFAGNLLITPTLEAKGTYRPPPVALRPGWNVVAADLGGAWLPQEARRSVSNLQWILSSDNKSLAGRVIFDNMRVRMRSPSERGTLPGIYERLREGWEGKILWGVYSDEVRQEPTSEFVSEGRRAVKLSFDLAKFNRPVLYAPLNPLWDLGRVSSLMVDVYVPKTMGGTLTINFAAKSAEKKYNAPAIALRPGWNKVAARLGGNWLPVEARKSIEQMEWKISADRKDLKGWVVFDNFRAE